MLRPRLVWPGSVMPCCLLEVEDAPSRHPTGRAPAKRAWQPVQLRALYALLPPQCVHTATRRSSALWCRWVHPWLLSLIGCILHENRAVKVVLLRSCRLRHLFSLVPLAEPTTLPTLPRLHPAGSRDDPAGEGAARGLARLRLPRKHYALWRGGTGELRADSLFVGGACRLRVQAG